jgi:hypothetical protein
MTEPVKLPASVAGWIRNHSVKNYWRVAGWYELDDLVQDGILKAYQCIDRYGVPGGPNCPICGGSSIRVRLVKQGDKEISTQVCRDCETRIVDPPHFMALVKTAFYKHIAELLRRKRGVDDVTFKMVDIAEKNNSSENDTFSAFPASEPLQEFAVLVAELPEKLRRVVEFYLFDDPTKLWRNLRVRLDGEDETLKQRLAKLTGFPQNEDFETALRVYLWRREADLT